MGGGLGLALGCDMRICADDARFRMPAGRLGLGYEEAGVQRFVSLIGAQNTSYSSTRLGLVFLRALSSSGLMTSNCSRLMSLG